MKINVAPSLSTLYSLYKDAFKQTQKQKLYMDGNFKTCKSKWRAISKQKSTLVLEDNYISFDAT